MKVRELVEALKDLRGYDDEHVSLYGEIVVGIGVEDGVPTLRMGEKPTVESPGTTTLETSPPAGTETDQTGGTPASSI